MQIKTLEDVLHWTTAYHELLSDSLAHAVERAENGAVSLLLDYLAKHESTYRPTAVGGGGKWYRRVLPSPWLQEHWQ